MTRAPAWLLAVALSASACAQGGDAAPGSTAGATLPATAPATLPPSTPAPSPIASAPAADCPPAPAVDPAAIAAEPAVDRGLLWKVTKDGRSSWLYGTIHVAKPAWLRPGPRVEGAIEAADTMGVELDVTDPDIVARLTRALARGPRTPVLPPVLEARLDAQARAECLDPASLAGLRPEMRAVTIALLGGRRFGLDPAFAVDAVLATIGHRLGKAVRSIETPESQAALLVSDDPAETARSVGEVLDEMAHADYAAQLPRLAGDWERGDFADLSAYATWCGCLETPDQRADFARMVDDRNLAMADWIARRHAEGHRVFAAVGSLHMVGEVGLPALLRARGFEVQRVDFAGKR
ncbi:MAG: TraB/GumN family protein [Burkholderiaceae bacterium]